MQDGPFVERHKTSYRAHEADWRTTLSESDASLSDQRKRRPLRLGFGRLVLGLGVAGLLALGVGFSHFAAMIETVERRPVSHAGGIVALTGGSERVPDAIALLFEGHADHLLITGVNPATTREDLARRVPNARALVECCVDLGYRAANTVGNAQETADWVRARHIRSLIVVTSNYHMPRALAEIAYELPGVELQAYPVVSERARTDVWWTDRERVQLVVREYVKYLVAITRQAVLPPAADEETQEARQAG